jgi:hypothetical protein
MTSLYTNIFDNPILTRELRRRMRGKALVLSIYGYLALMTVATILIIVSGPGLLEKPTQQMLISLTGTGRNLFTYISLIQALLVMVVAPTITAGMTTGERERKTFEFLQVTTITPWMYITGCFLSTVFYVSLALLCAFPLLSLVFVYGGATVGEVFARFFSLLGSSLVLSSFGLYISSIRERTRSAQGVIVFAIFAMLFGGVVVWQQLQRIFAGGTGTGTGATELGFAIGGFMVPAWLLLTGVVGVMTWVFLLLATRKLFDPENTRAFSHWQFAVFALVILVPQVLAALGRPVRELEAIAFLASSLILLLVAASCFAVGRMEVGDEIWHLKRVVPVLRPFDQTIPYLLGVIGLWWLALELFQTRAASIAGPKALFDIIQFLGVPLFLFLCGLGRFATSVAVGRRGAGRIVLATVAILWSMAAVAASVLEAMGLQGSVSQALVALSPPWMLYHTIDNEAAYTTAPELASPVGVAGGLYAASGLILLVTGEVLRYRRWKGFSYHYDMPARTA